MLASTMVVVNNMRQREIGRRNSMPRNVPSRYIQGSESSNAVDVDAQFCYLVDDQNLLSVDNGEIISDRSDESPKSQMLSRKWEDLVAKYCKRDNWKRLTRIMVQVPEEIEVIYKQVECAGNYVFSSEHKKKMYYEFKKASSCFKSSACFDTVHASEIGYLIRGILGVEIDDKILRELVMVQLSTNRQLRRRHAGRFDFKMFVSVMCDVLKAGLSESRENARCSSMMFHLPIDPDSDAKHSWDIFCLFLLLYCSFSVPYTIAFVNTSSAPDALLNSENLIDAVFLFDMFLSFLTGYEDNGVIIRELRKIAMNYLRTWFLPDLVGSFPFDKVLALVAQEENGYGATNLFRVLKFLRMLKLLRAIKLLNKLSKLRQKEGFEHLSNIIGLLSAGFLLMFMAHVLGCFFIILLDPEEPTDWLRHYRPELVDSENWVRYVVALYWAIITLTTTGYGDIIPVTKFERLFGIFVAIIGALVFSYCIGTISVLVSQFSTADTRYQERLRFVFEYLQFREISANLTRRIRSHFSLSFRQSPRLFEETETLQEINEQLRTEIFMEIGTGAIGSMPIFDGLDAGCIGEIVSRLKLSRFAPDQTIYSTGDHGTDLYIIVSGCVRLNPMASSSSRLSLIRRDSQENGENLNAVRSLGPGARIVSKGDIFGELALFPDTWKPIRPETAEAVTWTIAYTLSSDDMSDLEKSCPQFYEVCMELCKLKHLEASFYMQDHEHHYLSGDNASLNRLEFIIRQLKHDLLLNAESKMLETAGGKGGSEIMRLLLPRALDNISDALYEDMWRSISCVLSKSGELLFVGHVLRDLDTNDPNFPRSLGFLHAGRSTVRTLSSHEISQIGTVGNGLKTPMGVEIAVFSSAPLSSDGNNSIPCSDDDPSHIILCTLSSNDYDELCDSLSSWCSPCACDGSITPARRGQWEISEPSQRLYTPNADPSQHKGTCIIDSLQTARPVHSLMSTCQTDIDQLLVELNTLEENVQRLLEEKARLQRELVSAEIKLTPDLHRERIEVLDSFFVQEISPIFSETVHSNDIVHGSDQVPKEHLDFVYSQICLTIQEISEVKAGTKLAVQTLQNIQLRTAKNNPDSSSVTV